MRQLNESSPVADPPAPGGESQLKLVMTILFPFMGDWSQDGHLTPFEPKNVKKSAEGLWERPFSLLKEIDV